MPRIAVATPYFDFFPDLKAEFEAKYPGTKFRTNREKFTEDQLIDFLKGAEVALIGLDKFTDRVCASLPDLKVISLCSAGVDHIDPAILNKYGSIGASPYAVDVVSMSLETQHGVWMAEVPIKPNGISKMKRTSGSPEFRHFTEAGGRFVNLLPIKDGPATLH